MTAQITLSMLIRRGRHPEGLKQLLQGTHTQKKSGYAYNFSEKLSDNTVN